MSSKPQIGAAIVGMACRFPGAPDEHAFWQLLARGECAVIETPPDRWYVDDLYDDEVGAPGKISTRFGGFIQRYAHFDAEFFGINPREARSMDPQQRVLLELTWQALENAAIDPRTLAGGRGGVFVGASTWDYSKLMNRDLHVLDAYCGTGAVMSVIANRISYLLDLRGPSLVVDTACSSSLVAMHLAAQSLERGETDVAIVGAVNLILTPETTITLSASGALSPTGRCQTFAAGADGFVRSDGAGVLIMRRHADARADGDPIIGLLRGSAVNQDGRTNGLTSPNGLAQQAVIRAALACAGVAPNEPSYVEAHGTGTALGDPIEVRALGQVLAPGRSADRPCAVGAVKANIGHCEAAAGMAGVIKVLLAMRHELLPPQPPIAAVNPHVASVLERAPLQIVRELRAWQRATGDAPRIAAVSTFSFGGANAHAILEEAPVQPPASAQGPLPAHHVLKLTAECPAALAELALAYRDELHVRAAEPAAVADFCFTANGFRSDLSYRAVLSGPTPETLAQALERLAREPTTQRARKRPKLGVLFSSPPRAGDWRRFGRELHAQEPAFRAAFERCAALAEPSLPQPLALQLEVGPAESDEDRGPCAAAALFAIQYGLSQLFHAWGWKLAAVSGAGVGEYVACVVAGALTLEEALPLVIARTGLVDALSGEASLRRAYESPGSQPLRAHFERLLRAVPQRAPSAITSCDLSLALAGAATLPAEHFANCALETSALPALIEAGVDTFVALGPLAGSPVATADDVSVITAVSFGGESARAQVYRALHEAYGAGIAVDWRSFYVGQNRRRQRIAAYPFQGTRLWLPFTRRPVAMSVLPAGEHRPTRRAGLDVQALEHPLIGASVALAGSDRRLLTGRLAREEHGWLAAQRIHGAEVVPCTVWVELALFAADHVGLGAVVALTLESPLAVPEQGGLQLQLALGELDDAGRRSLELHAREECEDPAAPWLRCAHGALGPAAPAPATMERWPPPGAAPLELGSVYADIEARGLSYGEAFRGLRAVYRGHDALFAELALPDSELAQAETYCIHPALLDAALQAYGLDAEQPVLALEWRGVNLVAKGAASLRVKLRATPDGMTLSLASEDGHAIGHIEHVQTQPADAAELRELAVRAPALASELCSHPLQASAAPSGAAWRARLAPLEPDERARVLSESITSAIGSILGAAAADIEPDRPLSELGLDSRMAVELRNQLVRLTGLRLTASLLFDHPTPAALARLLNQRLFGAVSPQTADERISQSIRAIPLARLREAGLVELLLQLAEGHGDKPSNEAQDDVSSIDAMSVEELLRHARTS